MTRERAGRRGARKGAGKGRTGHRPRSILLLGWSLLLRIPFDIAAWFVEVVGAPRGVQVWIRGRLVGVWVIAGWELLFLVKLVSLPTALGLVQNIRWIEPQPLVHILTSYLHSIKLVMG